MAIVVLAAALLWLRKHPEIAYRQTDSASVAVSQNWNADNGDAPGRIRTKVSVRDSNAHNFTHRPERLREFMLPAMVIDGLTLDGTLRNLMVAYEDACRKSGETPLPLTFAIPPGAARKLTVHLPAGNFQTSVQLLAALSGMKVSRKELDYRFEPITNERKSVNQNLQVPPNFQDTLNEMSGLVSASSADPFAPPGSNVPKSIQECLGVLGLMDPSTHVSLGPSGELKLETTSTSDAAMITELVRSLDNLRPTQLKGEAKIVELPAGSNWNPPDVSQMTDGEIEMLIRDFAQRSGTELMTLPSVTSRNGQSADIEMVREVVYPTDDPNNGFESRNVGKVLQMQGNLIAFGQEMDLKFTDTTGGIDPSTGKATFDKRTDLVDKSYTDDGGSKLVVQTRPDGSRTLLLFRAQTIDAAGQPIR